MENNLENKINLIQRIKENVIKFRKTLITFLIILIILLISFSYLNYQQKKQNIKISEQFIKAGIYLSSKKNEESKKIYKEIIMKKNKFYSPLALNNIIEHELEKNETEVLNLFNVIEKIKLGKKQKNLIKLKKGLYLINISKDMEGKQLLQEIIDEDSIWKDTAIQILK